MRRLAAFALALGVAVPAGADEPKPGSPAELPPDVFADAMKDAGIPASEVGFRRKGTWSRYPDAPYKLPFFDDLLADPSSTYEFTRTLGNAVEDLLTPEKLRNAPDKDKPESLFTLGFLLGTDRRIGGIRGFGFNLLDAKPAEKEPLTKAVAEYWRRLGGTPQTHNPRMLGVDYSYPTVPDFLQAPLARLLLNLLDAHDWIERGLRRVTTEQRKAVFETLSDLVQKTPDGEKYEPVIEDVAREVDEQSLYYGCLKALAATQLARHELEELRPAAGWPEFSEAWDTPLGDVLFTSSGTDKPKTLLSDARDPFLNVIFGTWAGYRSTRVGATGVGRTLCVLLEMDPVGEIRAPEGKEEPPLGPAAGVLGCGIVYSAGDGKTTYEAKSWGLGAGMFGMGVLVDEGGDDTYRIREVGEGAGYFGVGLLLDAAGNDRYELLAGDGQGYGGCSGIGILADRSGNDTYYAEPRTEKVGKERGDYHSDQKIVGSDAQGAGMGRRGDVSDGHAWAGGLGALLDIEGDDTYEAGNFSQGCGYWFGTGLLYDGGGDDTYKSVYFSHASGAHFAVGCVVDEGGNDLHSLSDWPKVGLGPKAGAGIAFGWDVVNAILVDRAGNDRYEADIISIGSADVRSNAWLVDEGGDDTYVLHDKAQGFADVDQAATYFTPGRTGTFPFHLSQTALLLDLAGTDRYLRMPDAGGALVPDAKAGDGRSWGTDGPRGPGGGWNVARGRDVSRGRVGWLDVWPRRK